MSNQRPEANQDAFYQIGRLAGKTKRAWGKLSRETRIALMVAGGFLIIVSIGVFPLLSANKLQSIEQTDTQPVTKASPIPEPNTTMYAIEEAPLYTEPSFNSKRFKRAGASIPRTLSKFDDASVLEKREGWYKIESLGDIVWVPERYLVREFPDKVKHERLIVMLNNLNGQLSDHPEYNFYERISLEGNDVTLYVNDRWHLASEDTKIGFMKEVLMFIAGSRALEGVKDKIESLKIIHTHSDRVLATWDPLWGPKIIQ